MIIQFVLASMLSLIALLAFMRSHKAPVIGFPVMGLACLGIIFVIFPNITQIIANHVGVSRGVDLVIYVFMAIMLVVILDIYLRIQAMLDRQTILVRHICLQESERG